MQFSMTALSSIDIKRDKHIRIMFDRIDSTPQLKVVELYISVELRTELSGEDVQQTILEGGGGEKLQSLHADGHPTLTPFITVYRSSYQQECIQSLGGEDEGG